MAVHRRRLRLRFRLCQDGFGLLLVERRLATPTVVVVGSKLDKLAAVASHHFPGIYRS
jgi:hypothetical protein